VIVSKPFLSLNEDDFSLIGRLTAAFSVLDHTLGKLILWEAMENQLDAASDQRQESIRLHTNDVAVTFGPRAKKFKKQIDSELWGTEKSKLLISEAKRITELVEIRNAVCHGLWSADEKELRITFFSNDSIKSKDRPEELQFNRADLLKLVDETLSIDFRLYQEIVRFLS